MSNFYCQIKCGEVDFSIDQWNESYKQIMAMPISDEGKDKLINPEPCKEQCFSCVVVVGERRLKTKQLIIDSKG